MTERIKVWDVGVRVFHWSLLTLFVLAWISAEEEGSLHVYTGYAVAALVLFRLIWGLVGSRYARFSAFCYSATETLDYLRSSLNGKPKHYLSHNPLGALMVFALLLSLSGIVVTGLVLSGDLPGQTVAATSMADDSHDDEPDAASATSQSATSAAASEDETGSNHEFWEEVHEFFTNLTLGLIAVHVMGVVIASRQHKENLVKAMITGEKSQHTD